MRGRVTRREAVRTLGGAAMGAALSGWLAACAAEPEQAESRLRRALVALGGAPKAAALVAARGGMTGAEARAALVASPAVLWAVTSSRVALRAWLSRRRDADLRADRVRWIHGWLLTETEIAAATLIAG